MKKRIQVFPISSDDHSSRSALSTDASSKSSRSRIRLRNSSSKIQQRQQQHQGIFSKRPYLYKAAGQSVSLSRPYMRRPNGKRNRNNKNHRRNSISKKQITISNPVHWIDWVEAGMDFFGCGITAEEDLRSPEEGRDSSSPNRHAGGQQFSHLRKEDILANKTRHLELMGRDYVQLHEDFFDSLLKEEGDRILASILAAVMSPQQNAIKTSSPTMPSQQNAVNNSSGSVASENTNFDAQSSGDNNSSISNNTSNHTRTSISTKTVSSTKTVGLGRCGSFGSRRRKSTRTESTNIEIYDQMYNPDSGTNITKSASTSNNSAPESKPSTPSSTNITNNGKKSSSSSLSIVDIMAKTNLESPSYYLHEQCKLQKDKGKGDKLGKTISAEGREQTLTKLRDKMKLIVEVSGELESSSILSSFNNKDLASMDSPFPASGINSKGSTGPSKTMSAGMKRRRAKIALIEHNNRCTSGEENGSYIIETRSMIEFQLGFLSMQYGLLVRWDAYQTGQVVFVCLRKMCHDSFYTKIPSPPPIVSTETSTTATTKTGKSSAPLSQYPKSIMKKKSQGLAPLHPNHAVDGGANHHPDTISAMKKREITAPFVIRSPKGGNHAIYQRGSGSTEVVLVDAPYRVPHPNAFAPSVLSLDIHRLSGLDPKSIWTLIMTFDGNTEIAHLKYNHREGVFETTRSAPCKWELSMMSRRPTTASFDVATGLEIRLFEQRPKHRLRGVASGMVGMIGGRSSSSSTYVPAGSDPFSLHSPSHSYVIQNQRLVYYNSNNQNRNNRIFRSNSESSLGSGTSGTSNSSKKCTSRLASTMTVPLGGLVCQPSTSQTTLWKLTIPFTHNENAEVTLTLMHQSEYAYWLYQELRARRKEELVLSHGESPATDLWRRLVSPMMKDGNGDGEQSYDGYSVSDDSDDIDGFCMECLYCCCVDPR